MVINKKINYRLSTFIVSVFFAINVQSKVIDTATISQLTLNAVSACADYKIMGVCLWLRCLGPVCRVVTSPRISHYLPDVVVSVYARSGGNPWQEMALAGNSQVYKGGSVTRPSRPLMTSVSLQYKFADIIGNPLVSTTGLKFGKFSCQSAAVSFKPYFLSNYDAFSWIQGIPERLFPQSYIPGLREIGRFPLNSWGSVYPRTGFIMNGEEPKRAAVIAQRAADIVTRRWQPHIYIPLSGCHGRGCHPPPPLKENDPNSGKWQMLSPVAERQCTVFGGNDALRLRSWASNKSDSKQQYTWNLWRKYVCCIPAKGTYIGQVP